MATTRHSLPGPAAATGALLLAVGSAGAAPTTLQPTLDVRALVTDNSGLTTDAAKRSDVVGDIDAGLVVRQRGARVTLTGDVGLEFIGYARHTEPDRVLPRGRLDLNAILVEQSLFLDGGIQAERTRGDPLAPQVDGASTANTVSTVSLRASPYFQHDFSPTLSATARSDTIVTRSHGDDSTSTIAPNGSTYQREYVRVARKPVPLGVALEGSHDETTYQDRNTATLKSTMARATVSYAVNPEFIAGVVGGRDHDVYATTTQDEPRYGVMAQWRPSARTSVDADVEHRFFGMGWDMRLRHRTPLAIFDLTLQREPTATPPTFGLTGRDDDPALLLNSLLSSRVPDVVDRDKAVDTLVAEQGLPADFARPQQITSESAQLSTRAALNLVANGSRNTLFASAWYEKAQSLDGSVTVTTIPGTTFDSRQWGASLGLYHRLTPTLSGAVEIGWSDIEALGVRAGDSSKEAIGTISLTNRINRWASWSCGVRHLSSHVVLRSTTGTTQVDENQAFAGLRMQY